MRSRMCSASFLRPSRSSAFMIGNVSIVVVAVGFDGALVSAAASSKRPEAKYARPRMFQDPSQSGLRSMARWASSAASSYFFCA